ncbi:MAG TPA: hypothetical protein VER33_08570 [Polyangiaceae bacterium]|nr:hypothetical protein [Polyangiaceae bacterium]
MRINRRGARAPLVVPRSLICAAATLVTCVLLLLATKPAQAYPWMIRHGYTNCAGCHTDPSGGELLTLYGHAISYEALSTKWGGSPKSAAREERRVARAIAQAASGKAARPAAEGDEEEGEEEEAGEDAVSAETPAEPAEAAAATDAADAAEAAEEQSAETSEPVTEEPSPFDGMNPLTGPLFGLLPPSEALLLGGSVRLATIHRPDASSDKTSFFPMQIDLYGQARIGAHLRLSASLGVAKVPVGSPHARPAQVTSNQGEGYNAISRTHWVGWDFGAGAHLLRAGRIHLPFGIRMSEHVMWVRENTRTDRDSDQQHGVALHMSFESMRFELMAIAGNYQVNPDKFRERGYSGFLEYTLDPMAVVGISSLVTRAAEDRILPDGKAVIRQAHGVFARTAPSESVSVLIEANALLRSRTSAGYVGFVQLDVEPFQGFHLMGTGELRDQGRVPGRPCVDALTCPSRTEGQGLPEPGAWLSFQWFFLPHFDFRFDAILRNDKQLLGQLHVYL